LTDNKVNNKLETELTRGEKNYNIYDRDSAQTTENNNKTAKKIDKI
jgi:hypothetical protein